MVSGTSATDVKVCERENLLFSFYSIYNLFIVAAQLVIYRQLILGIQFICWHWDFNGSSKFKESKINIE